MKAVLALVVIYVVAFLVAIQGSAPVAVEASPQSAATKPATVHASSIDPAKEADIRALLDLVGARDQVQESVNYSAEQYREKLLATVANSDKNQAFVNAVVTDYEKKFDVNQVTEQLISIYDKHYSGEEIKELLQFYGSPLGQRVAAEASKISREMQAVTRATAAKAVKDALQETKEENPGVGQNVHLTTAPARRLPQRHTAQDGTQSAQQQDQP
jgi:uncharacterized protein